MCRASSGEGARHIILVVLIRQQEYEDKCLNFPPSDISRIQSTANFFLPECKSLLPRLIPTFCRYQRSSCTMSVTSMHLASFYDSIEAASSPRGQGQRQHATINTPTIYDTTAVTPGPSITHKSGSSAIFILSFFTPLQSTISLDHFGAERGNRAELFYSSCSIRYSGILCFFHQTSHRPSKCSPPSPLPLSA